MYPKEWDVMHTEAVNAVQAFMYLFQYVDSLSKDDKRDLFELLVGWAMAGRARDVEELSAIKISIVEILSQVPLKIHPMKMD